MPFNIHGPELLILFAIIVVLFGVGRIGKIASELGTGIRQFRDGLAGGDKPKPESDKP
jgi:sec-independent protein translocase protein TatA